MIRFAMRAGMVVAMGLAVSAWGQQSAGQQISHGAGQVANGTKSGAKQFGHGMSHGASNIGHGIAHGTKKLGHSVKRGFEHAF